MSATSRKTPDERDFVISRLLDAPRALVFKGTDPQHMAAWWGPLGFTTPTCTLDVRPGGAWRCIMQDPDGTDYPNERLVYSHVPTPRFQATVHFDDEGGRTRLRMRALFETAAERHHVVEVFQAIEGGKQTLRRLAAFLANAEVH